MKKRILSLLLALLLAAGVLSVCTETASAASNGVSDRAFTYLANVCRTQGTLRDDQHYVFTSSKVYGDVWKFRFDYDPAARTVSVIGCAPKEFLKPDGSLRDPQPGEMIVTEIPRPRLVICPSAQSPMTAQMQLYGDHDGKWSWFLLGESYLSDASYPFVNMLKDFDAYYPDVYDPNLEQVKAMHPEANIDGIDEAHWNHFHYHVSTCYWMTEALQAVLEPGGFRWQDLAPDSPPPHHGKGVDGAFTDVQMRDFFYGPVLWCALKDITQGTSETTFSPQNTCTRAEVVTFLWRAAGAPEPKARTTGFADVSSGTWYSKAVSWAVERGITDGVDETHFAPDLGCTRGHVVTFLARAKQGVPSPGAACSFVDVNKDEYYYSATLWAVEQNITQGVTATTFAPNDVCTRGQIATFLFRAYADSEELFEPVVLAHDFI